MKILRDYQTEISTKGRDILLSYHILYLAMQVRTGKTSTALNVCKLCRFKKVLFLTKKKAISSIESDYNDFGFHNSLDLVVLNNESLHNLHDNDFDCIIMDEAHRLGSFPKPAKIAKDLKIRFSHLPIIFLSGTPNPESYSQIYHQLWVSLYSPFKKYTNFYKWAKDYVSVSERNFGYGMIKDYSKANKDIIDLEIKKLFITYTQEQANFTSEINEHVLFCNMKESTYKLCNQLYNKKVISGKEETILADTAVKMMQKLHQMYSGTVKFESGNSKVLDTSKAEFIKEEFAGKKIAIFYKFKEEYKALKEIFGDQLTNDLDNFNNSSTNIALQIVSGREGISLKAADYLVYYNIDFSAVSYFQSRDRLTTMERKNNDIYWIFSTGGIEEKIYKSVMNKKDFTLSVFKNTFMPKDPAIPNLDLYRGKELYK